MKWSQSVLSKMLEPRKKDDVSELESGSGYSPENKKKVTKEISPKS